MALTPNIEFYSRRRAYYERFGFEPARRKGIEPPGGDFPGGVFSVKRLSGYSDRFRGHIVYPPAFDVT